MNTTDRIPLSVSVIMFTAEASLTRCLDALVDQKGVSAPEILVPHDDSLINVAALRARYPQVRFLAMTGRRTPAELRACSVRQAHGRVIGLLEDHCIPEPDWCARVIEAHEEVRAAVGGAVEKGFAPDRTTDSTLNWAVYMTDYSRYMNPMPAGPSHSLTDCNVTYSMAALEPIADLWQSEFHENIVNGKLHDAGGVLWFEPRMIVREYRPLTLGAAVRDRYAFGRLFASTRVEHTSLAKRLVMAAASLIMPPILTMRAARNLLSRRRHRGQIFRCAPALLFVASVWMIGEMVGYLTASPGDLRPADGTRTAAGEPKAARGGG
jgi:hypothetical protein